MRERAHSGGHVVGPAVPGRVEEHHRPAPRRLALQEIMRERVDPEPVGIGIGAAVERGVEVEAGLAVLPPAVPAEMHHRIERSLVHVGAVDEIVVRVEHARRRDHRRVRQRRVAVAQRVGNIVQERIFALRRVVAIGRDVAHRVELGDRQDGAVEAVREEVAQRPLPRHAVRLRVPRRVEQRRRPAALGLAVTAVVQQRVEARLLHVGVGGEIPGGLEPRVRPAPLAPAEPAEMRQLVGGGRYVGMGGGVENPVEQASGVEFGDFLAHGAEQGPRPAFSRASWAGGAAVA